MYRPLSAAILAGLSMAPCTVLAEEPALLDTIVVTATRVAAPDVAAPYASEVHTRRMIEQSGSASLFDYLAQHSSVQVMPSYGSRAMPLLDMRGYGLENGYQNIVISLDGRRLNGIDMNSPLLGTIPLAEIDRIEITKGSGSVLYGDGATAGSIQIYTRAREGGAVQLAAGNFGARNVAASVSLNADRVQASASGTYDALDGMSAADSSGHRDASHNRNWHGALTVQPRAGLALDVDANSARLDGRYVYPLTLNEFNRDPAQFPAAYAGNPYNRQLLDSDQWRVGAGLDLDRDWKLVIKHGREDRRSTFIAWYGTTTADYDYTHTDLMLQHHGAATDVTVGMQRFEGVRGSDLDHTSKDNASAYVQGQHRVDGWTLSAGLRGERVDYRYEPISGTGLRADHWLNAWDLGVNRRLEKGLSVFANLNQAYQAPDIDRFFDCVYNPAFQCVGKVFNGFIRPERSRTLNVGLNHEVARNRLKATLYYADLRDEIYFSPSAFANTNLDKTHKYGLEIQDTWRFAPDWSAVLNYTYTRARIDRENDGGGAFNGKDIPGVPQHGAVFGLSYAPTKNASVSLTHTWREATWAIGDFDNNNSQRQEAYQSTDLSYRQRVGAFEWTAAVQNLFEHRNGLWTGNNSIYPVNFARTYRLGVSAQF